MISKEVKRAALGACVFSPLALGVVFTHTGDGPGNYNDESKWTPAGGLCYPSPFCYPHSTADDAVINGTVIIKLTASAVNDNIDDLYISERGNLRTDFTTDGPARTLRCESITFSDAWAQVADLAGLVTRQTEPCPEK